MNILAVGPLLVYSKELIFFLYKKWSLTELLFSDSYSSIGDDFQPIQAIKGAKTCYTRKGQTPTHADAYRLVNVTASC